MIEFFDIVFHVCIVPLMIFYIVYFNKARAAHFEMIKRSYLMPKALDRGIIREEIGMVNCQEKLTTPPDRGSSIQPPALSPSFTAQFARIPRFSNCPNCGAPAHGNHCEYCNTNFFV
jgi:hypothetical protein